MLNYGLRMNGLNQAAMQTWLMRSHEETRITYNVQTGDVSAVRFNQNDRPAKPDSENVLFICDTRIFIAPDAIAANIKIEYDAWAKRSGIVNNRIETEQNDADARAAVMRML